MAGARAGPVRGRARLGDEPGQRPDASHAPSTAAQSAASPTALGLAEPTDDDLRAFLELPTELFGVFDPKDGLVWCNATVAGVLGYRPEELVRVDLGSLVHPDDLGSPTEDVEDFPRDGAALTLEVRCRCKDGTWRWLEWAGSWDDSQGVLYGSARDVTDRHAAEAALREHEQLMQAILDHSGAAIYVMDAERRFVLLNDAFLRAFGLSREEVLGRTRAEIWGSDGAEAEAERRVLATGMPIVRDDVAVTGDGARILMTVRFPLRDAEGAVTGMAAIATDVTDRTDAEQALAERERVLDTILRACPDIVTMFDATGSVRELSQAAARILGHDVGDPVEPEILELVHEDDRDAVRAAFGDLVSLRTGQLDLRFRVRHDDGHWITLDSRGQSIVDDEGHGAGAVVVSRDVTGDLDFEEELQAAVDAAERASTAKSDFLSRMSHELRTPLNSVLGFAQLLGMEELDEQQHEAVGHIIRAGHHLLGLIDEVLDIARIESGRLDLAIDSVDVGSVVADAVDLTRPLAEDRGIQISVDLHGCPPDAHVRADRQRLLQVLLNLLSNGVKYNVAGGRVWVTVTDDGSRTELVVRDTGRGIDPADVDRVFEPFDRLGAERSGVEGTGVGLTLSKHLVDEMGGTIAVSSVFGEGSTFTVTLQSAPAQAADALVAPARRSKRSVAGALRVLHIEDNLANLELVEQILTRAADVELLAAMSGSLGTALAREQRPDLILLDLHLPDMPGTAVLEQLHQDPATDMIPVVVISADATPTTVRQLRSGGVLAYLTKPIDVQELLRVVSLVSSAREPS